MINDGDCSEVLIDLDVGYRLYTNNMGVVKNYEVVEAYSIDEVVLE